MSNDRLQADSLHTTIDRVFLVLHIEQCEEALKLLASLQDRATEVQTCIHEGRILCFAYLDFSLQTTNMDECMMIELDLRTCLHTDLQVFKIPPLENERFQVVIFNSMGGMFRHIHCVQDRTSKTPRLTVKNRRQRNQRKAKKSNLGPAWCSTCAQKVVFEQCSHRDAVR